jgi:RNA polymerase primary sigma factor
MRQLKIPKQVTKRESLSVEKYLQEIGKVDLITVDKEEELARRIRKGDNEALEELVKANLRFVVSVAKQYQNQGLSLPDLINEGNLGLIKAAQRFDETRGFKFISYAVWWVRQSILQALAEQSRIVRLPLNKIGSISKLNKIFNELNQQFEREPSIDEIAKVMEVSPEEVNSIMINAERSVSMDAPVGQEEDYTLGDFLVVDNITPEKQLLSESLSMEINRLLSVLTEREASILMYYYGLNGTHAYTLDEISEKIGLTRERVRQLKEKALKRLKHTTKNKILKYYLG